MHAKRGRITLCQEAVDDVPKFFDQWPVPPTIAPHVPAISEPTATAWANAGVAAAGGERPNLVAGMVDEAVFEALQALDTEFPGTGSCVLATTPPPTMIKRESVGCPRWVDDVDSRDLVTARCLRYLQG